MRRRIGERSADRGAGRRQSVTNESSEVSCCGAKQAAKRTGKGQEAHTTEKAPAGADTPQQQPLRRTTFPRERTAASMARHAWAAVLVLVAAAAALVSAQGSDEVRRVACYAPPPLALRRHRVHETGRHGHAGRGPRAAGPLHCARLEQWGALRPLALVPHHRVCPFCAAKSARASSERAEASHTLPRDRRAGAAFFVGLATTGAPRPPSTCTSSTFAGHSTGRRSGSPTEPSENALPATRSVGVELPAESPRATDRLGRLQQAEHAPRRLTCSWCGGQKKNTHRSVKSTSRTPTSRPVASATTTAC